MERIPILRMGKYLLVTIQVDMHDRLAMQLQEDLTARIAAVQARGVLIDISALDMVDSFIGRMLSDIAGMSRILVDQTKIVTAASEIARNTVIYGRGGTVRIEALVDGIRKGLRLTFEDQGPGIADLELAQRDGYTTGTGLGMGLGGARRLVNEFAI